MPFDATAAVREFLRLHHLDAVKGDAALLAATQAVAAIAWGEGRTLEEVLATKRVASICCSPPVCGPWAWSIGQ